MVHTRQQIFYLVKLSLLLDGDKFSTVLCMCILQPQKVDIPYSGKVWWGESLPNWASKSLGEGKFGEY